MREAYAPPALQAVKRDFAFLVPADAPADALLRAVRGADRQAIAGVCLFDVFTGPGVPEGHEVARRRGRPPAGREELHRGGIEGDLGADRRRRRQGRCPAPRLRRGGPGRLRRAGGMGGEARLALHGPAVPPARRAARPVAREVGPAGARLAGPGRRRRRRCAASPDRRASRAGPPRRRCRSSPPAIRPTRCPTRSSLWAALSAGACAKPDAAALARQRAADQRGRPLGGADERAARRRRPVSAADGDCSSSAPAPGSTCCSTAMATISAGWRPAIRPRRFGSGPEWKGAPPPDAPVEVARRRGVDLQPARRAARRRAAARLCLARPAASGCAQLEAALARRRRAIRRRSSRATRPTGSRRRLAEPPAAGRDPGRPPLDRLPIFPGRHEGADRGGDRGRRARRRRSQRRWPGCATSMTPGTSGRASG